MNTENTEIEGIKVSPVVQIGTVVKSVDESAEHYQRVFGIGPFQIVEMDFPQLEVQGKLSPMKARLGFAQIGGIQFELIEVLEGESPYAEFLRSQGEGLHHLAFRVDDLDGCISQLEKLGVGLLLSLRMGKGGAVYTDGGPVGGVPFELMQRRHSSE